MGTPSTLLWKLDPHTKAKHAILSEYLKAWFQIVGKTHSKLIFIDGFAGPGRYSEGEPGSPLIALDIAKKANISSKILFQFVEEDKNRFKYLKNELNNLKIPPSFDISIENESFSNILSSTQDYLERNHGAPIFAFIDPFGFKGIPFNLIKNLLSYQKCEIFINFMIDSTNRFLEHPEKVIRCYIYELLGSSDVSSIIESDNRIAALQRAYEERLKSVAKFVLPFEMRNKKDRTQFFLFFASNHRLGHIKMKEAMWRIDKDGEFSFSDASYGQQSLFRDFNLEQKIRGLLSEIIQNFATQTVPCKSVETFVEDKTIFLKSHLKNALKIAEEEAKISVEALKSDGKKRIKNTFPGDTIIKFC
ncbi:three-Cys-motif partner protein TcmP [Leptospirillum ferriphilum]|uniref:three-Cys-motif partner protein TcmP n=1 Tax=Leptospirillum ferriphilum TaxID=178606 RepID=UPI0009877AE9|nr:three-Cys-motif partner protein TcmP [Leptospirillum ferriphilum]OOH75894.1 hypothetical protein BOX30_11395 [Leptospirillum ferriphilum]